MANSSHSFGGNVFLLKQKASKHSIFGVAIAICAIIIATVLSAYFSFGEISIRSIIKAQKTNTVLWFLDAMPFIFAIWGQYVSSILSYEASALIVDQTSELRAQTERMEKKAAYEATHDSLTGLPNRTLFIDRLQQATTSARRNGQMLGVFILDMDRFKEVNDSLGHYNGDRLLKLLAMRISGVLREVDTLARIGGDEFGFIFSGLKDKSNLGKIAKKLKKSLSTPFALDDISLDVQVSIGATFFPEHGQDADTLMQRADVAMYAAKKNNLDFFIYSKDLDKDSQHRLTLMGELRHAINNDELLLHYQPKITNEELKIFAVEALVRWQHQNHGLMPPNEFIPMAERTGLIKDLTIWVLKNSLRQCSEWRDDNFIVDLAVNISSHSLLDLDFPEVLTGILAAQDFPPDSLILEITETTIMADPKRSLDILHRLTDMGIKLSIDDFGTGYSSLEYLKRLPVRELKIDKSFVMDMLKDESDATIVNAIIQLGHNLGLEVVAEGVESQETLDKLKVMGCDLLQGFHICRPLPQEHFITWAKQYENV